VAAAVAVAVEAAKKRQLLDGLLRPQTPRPNLQSSFARLFVSQE
jgi:hypothetical protein